nr:FAD-dependent oxidoreductase [Cupriavidus sp. LEh25]
MQPQLDGHTNADVVIIGAGFAGLCAALELARHKVKVVVLEPDFAGSGASSRNAGYLAGAQGLKYDRFLQRIDRDLLVNAMSILVCSEHEQGLAQFLYWCAICFGDWNAFKENSGHWPIEGGTGRLINAISAESRAELRLSTPVAAVDDNGREVMVTTRDGQRIRARHVVVALPLIMLHELSVTPPLPQPVRAMIEQKNPIMPSKIWVRVKGEIEPFVIYAPVGKHPINTAHAERRGNGDTLVVCFCCDTSALDGNDREAVQRALRDFVPDIEVLDTVCQDWANDAFARGGWMHHRPGNLTQAAPLMRTPHGRIHFAGADKPGSVSAASTVPSRPARGPPSTSLAHWPWQVVDCDWLTPC